MGEELRIVVRANPNAFQSNKGWVVEARLVGCPEKSRGIGETVAAALDDMSTCPAAAQSAREFEMAADPSVKTRHD